MKLFLAPLLLLAPFLSLAHAGDLDQVSPYTNSWFHCHEPIHVWQQQVRVGIAGELEAFEVAVTGPVGAQVELRLRVGDGWNDRPAAWSTLFTKTSVGQEIAKFDVADAELFFVPGDTFVIEAQGNDTGADLRGSYMHPEVGDPEYPEELFLSGPGCYENCGWRIGFRTWMHTDTTETYCVSLPNSTGFAASISHTGSISIAANDLVLHAGPAPAGRVGLFLYGPERDALALGDGVLCIGAGTIGIARLPLAVVDGSGSLTCAVDNTTAPIPGADITVGSTWCFQAIFRDPAGAGGGMNLSDGLEITFQP